LCWWQKIPPTLPKKLKEGCRWHRCSGLSGSW
jgi:hypothetical protein